MRIRRVSFRVLLAVLVLAATVPLALFAGALVLSSWRDQIAVADRQTLETARAVAVAIDKEIESAIAALNVLATVDALDNFDSKRFRDAALRLLVQQPGWMALLLLEPSGRILENTADPSATGSEESAEWVRTVAKTRRAAVSDLFEDAATRRHYIVVAVPVKRGNVDRYMLAARLSAANLSEILRRHNPPAEGVFTLIDGRKRIIARTRGEQEFVGKPPSAGFLNASERMSQGNWREVLLEGTPAYASLSRSTLTGWTVGIGRPVEEIDGPIKRSIWALAAAGVFVLSVALSVALILGHLIVRSVYAASAAAKALARGQPIAPRASRLAELDDLWRGLGDAQSILDRRQHERDEADHERVRALAAERLARQASEKDQARLAVILRSIGDAVIATDTAGRVTLLNTVAQRLTGWSEETALERPIEEVFRIIDEGTRQPVENPVKRAVSQGRIVAAANHRLLLARDGREIPITDSAAPLIANDGSLLGVVLAFRDVTAAREGERVRAASLEREQAARREAEALSHSKDEFVAMVSHELRTPLSAIYGWTRLLRRGALDAAAQSRALDVIERNTRAQAQLIDDLLDMSRVIRGNLRLEMAAVDLPAVLQSAADAVRLAADAKQIALDVVIEKPTAISGDSDRLQQVLCNVLNNAIKFTPQTGRIEARLGRDGADAVIRVCDTGIGIAPDMLQHIFQPFRQGSPPAARTRGGLGIGLALVRHLVELHGGNIRAESDGEGCGATFTIRLPALRAAAGPAEPGTPPDKTAFVDPARLLAGLHVLLVDDDGDLRELVGIALREAGAEVSTAASTAEALRILEVRVPDVVVSDIGMPEATGYELVQRMHASARTAHVPIVALTAYNRSEDREEAYRAGFDLHIGKPVEPLTLVRSVATAARNLKAVV